MAGGKIVRGCEVLRTGRKMRGFSQSEVAAYYGVCLKTYRRWERGERSVSYDALNAICGGVFKLELSFIERAIRESFDVAA